MSKLLWPICVARVTSKLEEFEVVGLPDIVKISDVRAGPAGTKPAHPSPKKPGRATGLA